MFIAKPAYPPFVVMIDEWDLIRSDYGRFVLLRCEAHVCIKIFRTYAISVRDAVD